MSRDGLHRLGYKSSPVCATADVVALFQHLDHDKDKGTYLIMYGTIDTTRQANAAHVRYKPLPTETIIPIGTGFDGVPIKTSLMASTFFSRTVHIAAPMRRSKLPATEKIVDTKNVKLFLRMPLKRGWLADVNELVSGVTDVSNAKAEQTVPSNNIQYAALVDCPK